MTINPTATSTAVATSGVDGQKATLGKDAFLQLLMIQLQHQDPTQPQDDSAFIAQLAQFSSLEKLTTIDTSLTTISQMLSAGAAFASSAATSTPVAPVAPAAAPDTPASIAAQIAAATKKGLN